MRPISIALRRYPHTADLLDGPARVDGADLRFVDVDPIHEAFAPMVRELRYDLCELALATLLQAHELGVRITALPLVLLGSFPHKSLYRFADQPAIAPEELSGCKVGVRSYSQTTGLWLRGVLRDTYGIGDNEITWVTTEGSHVSAAADPEYVERTSRSLVDELRDGSVSAIVLGAPFAAQIDGLVPVFPDWERRQEDFLASRGWVPINHLLVVRSDLLKAAPEALREIFRRLAHGIDDARAVAPAGSVASLSLRYGVDDVLVETLQAAARYAFDQRLIRRPIDPHELFTDVAEVIS